jgi:hypothetical protein
MNITAQHRKTLGNSSEIIAKSLLFLLASYVCVPTQAAVTTANVSANIISVLSITNQSQNGLVFGDIASSPIAGTIILTPSGSRTSTGGATINSTTAGSPAAFDIQCDVKATYINTLPPSVILNGESTGSMVVNNFTSSPSNTGVLDGTGRQALFIGGDLNVGSNQAFGSYKGQMTVTVAYN